MAKIKLAVCNPDIVKKTLASLGLEVTGSKTDLVKRLAKYYADNETRLDIADCDVCGGDSDANLDACPFCGEEGVIEDDPAPEKAPAKKAPAKKAPAKKKTTKKAPVESKAPAKKKTPKTKAADARAAKEVAAAKARREEAAKKKAAVEKPVAKAPTPKASDAVANATIVSVKDLDKQVDLIRKSVTAGALALHSLGAAAKVINDSGLWKMRMSKGDVGMYRSFKQFCVEDLGMTPQHIYRAIKVAEDFTETEVKGLSGKQIRVVMQLPKGEERNKAIDAAKNGEGTDALSARAAALKGDKAGETPAPAKAVTVAIVPGITKVPLYKRGKGKVMDPESATPATSMSDKPWLAIELKNKVRLLVRLDQAKDGTLQAAVEFRRGEVVI